MTHQTKKVRYNLPSTEDPMEKIPSIVRELLSEGFPPGTYVGLIVYYPVTGVIKVRGIGSVPDREALAQLYSIAAGAVSQSNEEAGDIANPTTPDGSSTLN